MLEIVHCILDEKFINGIIDVFDRTQGEHHNSYVYFPEGKQESSFRYLKNPERVTVVNRRDALDYIRHVPCDVLILHNLSAFPIESLASVDSRVTVLWLAWGYDLYSPFKGHRPFITVDMFRPLTRAAIRRDWSEQALRMAKRTRWCLLGYDKMVEEGVGRVDLFSGVIPWEHEMMKRHPFFKAERVDFTYFDMNPYATEETFSQPFMTGSNILLGNSAGNTNNHIDVMDLLSRSGIGDKKVIVPLSYGGSKHYVDQVIKAGRNYFGSRFVPLNTFIPLDEYREIIASCGYAVYGIERQQALGNVWLAMWNGLSVFMTKTSPLYAHLLQQGYRLFSLQDDLGLIANNYKMPESEVMDNRRTRLRVCSQEVNLAKVMTLYSILEKKKNG